MKPVRTADLTNAVPVDDGRGRRTPLTLLHLSVRDHFLRAAADIHCTGMSDRAAAAWPAQEARSLQGMRVASESRRGAVSTKTCRARRGADVVRVEMLRPRSERAVD
jgi:hypothetical protein